MNYLIKNAKAKILYNLFENTKKNKPHIYNTIDA